MGPGPWAEPMSPGPLAPGLGPPANLRFRDDSPQNKEEPLSASTAWGIQKNQAGTTHKHKLTEDHSIILKPGDRKRLSIPGEGVLWGVVT